jgi:transposase
MMRPANELPVVYLCREYVDFRKGINGLAVLVEATLRLDPFSERNRPYQAVIVQPGRDRIS